MRFVDWILLIVGLAAFLSACVAFQAQMRSASRLTIALALAVLAFALGLKSLLDFIKSRAQITNP